MKRIALALCLVVLTVIGVKAAGWPANYQGVMLQGFYWDSYTDSKWTKLESQADELSTYFSLIWIPNSGRSASNGMGYDPVYWFTNHYTKFGTETELKNMIATFKAKGTGIIADVVINHRSGKSNWTDFPAEVWNGKTWQLGPEHICRDDEVKDASGQAKPTGNYDTGEGYGSSRDLDHTNAVVQDNCKNYIKCLLEKYGYSGIRLDYCKGYKGDYIKIYNQYAKPKFSVGEVFDYNYNTVANWIEATGKESAAFDFPFKNAVNKAFSSGNMTELVWMANGSTPQPAGMIHYGYPQYAVTFIDNHDTARDNNKFTGNIVAANAFMLCCPGTPCVYLPHYQKYKSQIQKLINIRNSVGLHNMSPVSVLRHTSDCYMAEVTGTKGKLVVKIGSAMVSPSGYSDSDIKASGDGYCIWSKTGVNPNPNPNPDPDPDPDPDYPSSLYIIGNVNGNAWNTATSIACDSKSNGVYTWNDVTIDPADAEATIGYFSFVTTRGADWDEVNSADRYGAATKDELITSSAKIVKFPVNVSASAAYSWSVAPKHYKIVADLKTMTLTISDPGTPGPTPGPDPDPDVVYVFLSNTGSWSQPHVWAWNENTTTVTAAASWPGDKMTKVSGNLWRWDLPAGKGAPTMIIFNDGNKNQTDDLVFENKATYDCTGNIIGHGGVGSIIANPEGPAIYYNMQGQRVDNPANGQLLIECRGAKARKIIFVK